MNSVGIVGVGFVGKALLAGFASHFDVKAFDIKGGYDTNFEVAKQDIIFVCVPTPVKKNGKQKFTYLHDAMHRLNGAMPKNSGQVIVIKSTILPGTSMLLRHAFPDRHIVVNPEFLTARTARIDFICPARIIIGGDDPYRARVAVLYDQRFPGVKIFLTGSLQAELIKYWCNLYFATKVSFLNEMYDTCNNLGIDYKEMAEMFMADGRVGYSHYQVPGPDGDRGFGGTCFPKDLKAYLTWAKEVDMPHDILDATQRVNDRVRTKIDWKEE